MESMFNETIAMPAWVPIVALLVTIVAKILNKATKHFSEKKGFVKWALFIVDVLDIFKSTQTAFKRGPTLALVFALGLSGCATVPFIAGQVCKWVPVAQAAHKAVCDVLEGNAKSKCLASHDVGNKVKEIAEKLDKKTIKVCK